MNIPKPPETTLIDSFDYAEYLGVNDYSEPEYADPIAIENARIDRSVSYSANDGKTVLYDAVIFCYAELTNPIPNFKEQSKVSFDGQSKIIQKVIPNYEPFSKALYSIELEVV